NDTRSFRIVMTTAAATAEAPVPLRPGRPRSAEADAAIREATIGLLADAGYANLTMSGIAATAGVSTATLYRRWRSKVDLVVDMLSAPIYHRVLITGAPVTRGFADKLVDLVLEAVTVQ